MWFLRLSVVSSPDPALLYHLANLLNRYGAAPEAKAQLRKQYLEYTEQQVIGGSQIGLAGLCIANRESKSTWDFVYPDEAAHFWETVDFLVVSYFYNHGARHLGDMLGMKLINERGCVRDFGKIKAIYLDLLLHKSYDRDRLLTMLNVSHGKEFEDLYETERICRRQIADGKPASFWRLILIALLSNDPQKLEAACDEAIAFKDGQFACNVAKAYHMLRQA